ncbi:MAG: hypothetical protein HY925_08895 [Elusimicrobia bacterium]|nr:hypothetical protein [Elusimicrobiota bacterium]
MSPKKSTTPKKTQAEKAPAAPKAAPAKRAPRKKAPAGLQVFIDYPREGDVILPEHYTIRIGTGPAAASV